MKRVEWLLLAACLLPGPAGALESDKDQPISVEADSLEVREQDNVSIYRGNVSLVQGSLEIRSDRLVIHFNDERELVLMEMTGTPARFRQLDDERQEMRGQARQINYNEAESLLELIEEARFDHAGDMIESDRILIDNDSNSIQAGSAESDQRVKMLIQPRQDEDKTE